MKRFIHKAIIVACLLAPSLAESKDIDIRVPSPSACKQLALETSLILISTSDYKTSDTYINRLVLYFDNNKRITLTCKGRRFQLKEY